VASSRARRQLVPRCAAMLTPPSAGRAEQKSHLADERFHDPRTPQRTSASATSRSRRLSRRGTSRVIAFASAVALAALWLCHGSSGVVALNIDASASGRVRAWQV